MKRLLIALSLIVASLALVQPASAVAPPESCRFDPATGGSGIAATPAFNDGYSVDRMDFDQAGRLYVVYYRIVNNSYVVDRLRRFLPDGSLDQSFGSNGVVDLPGQVFNNTGRLVTVDDLGRVWVARNTYSNVREVMRLTPDGRVDNSLTPVELEIRGATYDPVGAMTADGDGVVLGHASGQGENWSVLHLVRIASDGSSTEVVSGALGGRASFISAVDPSGWMAGNTRLNSVARPLLWSGGLAGGFGRDLYNPSDVVGAFSEVVVRGGEVTALGIVVPPPLDDAVVMTLSFDDAANKSFFGPASATGGDELAVSDLPGVPLAIFEDDLVVGMTGADTSTDLFVGTMNAAGVIEVETTEPNVGVGAYPGPSVVSSTGSRMVGGFASFDADQAFIIALTPELGPEVSPNALNDQISRLYEAYYLRAPDPGGLAYWREQRAKGRSLANISAQFAGSDEFVDLYGDVTDAEFIDLIYNNVLGRAGEAGGRTYWTNQLTSSARTRGAVMLEFSESAENLGRTGTVAAHDHESGSVYRLYQAYLGRSPDAGGSCFWVRRLAGGASLDDVSSSFAASQEFVGLYGALSNRAFVELVYDNVLGRAGEAEGVAFWTAELDSARRNRGQVMTGFSESAEHIERTGTLPASS